MELKRKSIRLRNYDYSKAGAYFVTICTHFKHHLLGKIQNRQMKLNDSGEMVNDFWFKIPNHFPNVQLDQFVIMPNHIHAILIFVGAGFPRPNNQTLFQNKSNKKPMSIIDNQKCTDLCDDKRNKGRGDPAPTLGQIIGYFKYGTTKQINLMLNAPGKQIWQRNYYEHIIRDESDLHDTREYIVNNPYGWEKDEYYS